MTWPSREKCMNDVVEEFGKNRVGMSVGKDSVGGSRTVRWWWCADEEADGVPGGRLASLL